MRSFTFLFLVISIALSVAALVVADRFWSPLAVPKGVAPPATPTVAIAASCAPDVDGICVTVDGQTLAIPDEAQVGRYSVGGANVLNIAKNRRPSQVAGGNGVWLELQSTSGNDGSQESFAAGDLKVVTFVVWKGSEVGYLLVDSQPVQGGEGLALSPTDGRLVGSFEAELSGQNGKMRARAEFSLPLPE